MRMFWHDLPPDEPELRSSPVAAWHDLPSRAACAGRDGTDLLGAAITREELRSAYRTLARETHPDRMPEAQRAESEERMKRLNAAYRTLLDQMSPTGPLPMAHSAEQRAR